MKVKTVRT